ncbi:hypothetical protein RHGRI_033720 [Rhododendron griersonianum]|uniref:FBD domain-containing protein n=1 Tax=Rhododendron griersonianum TaxID=479676 RepID=A0AAV6HXW5_9ERIC|nr:hypothetical protein RHGRI_033720 [Rhododendron griersonianum]
MLVRCFLACISFGVCGWKRRLGIEAEMKFIKLLLAKSPMLETMDIKLKPMQIAKELSIVKKLTGFQRASPHAVIKIQ